MRSISLPLVALLAVACSSDPTVSDSAPLHVGSFRVTIGKHGLKVSPADQPDRVLLESFAGGEAAYGAVATRRATAKWEFQYGSFKVEEGPQSWMTATGTELAGLFPTRLRWSEGDAEVAKVELTSPAEGALLITVRAANLNANRVSLAFACAEGDRFLGFGGQADALDHRGEKVQIWTSEPGIGKTDSDEPSELWFLEGTRHASSFGLPTWLSPRGYVGVVESDRRTVFELCSVRDDAWRVETWGPELKLWLFHGPEPAKALERATASVLKRPVIPPPLAFAPWNDAIYGEENVRRIAQLIRDEKIPSSAIWTEDFRGGHDVPGHGYRLKEEWDTDRELYPDPAALGAELRAQGFAWFAYFNTFIVEKTRVFAEAERDGHFVKSPAGGPYIFDGVTFEPSGLADLSRPETRAWIKSYLHKALDDGFDGWMADFGEWLPHDAVLHSGEDPQAAHNRYAHEWAVLNAEVLAERAGDGRQRLFFSRAGWLGTNAVAPVIWAGDQRTDFQPDDGMPTVITMGLNLGLAGVSTYGHDIAGYQSATNPPSTKELFFRWTTLGALSPVMRTHHGLDARNNWWFGADAETIAHFRRWAELHIRLFPYFTALAQVAHETGMPIMRALPLAFPDFEPGWTIKDQYLLGPSLLVAPVIEEGKTARSVQLPPGRWLPLDGGEPVTGPATIEVSAPMSEIPIFGRAGSIVPLLPEGVQSLLPAEPPVTDLDDVGDRRALLVFAGASGSFDFEGKRVALTPASDVGGGFVAGGKPLPACTTVEAVDCVEETAGTRTKVRLSPGHAGLEFAGHRLDFGGVEVVEVTVVEAGR